MKLKRGDKVWVKTFKVRPSHWNSHGEMDYIMGTEVEILSVDERSRFPYNITAESGTVIHWVIKDSDIDWEKTETKTDVAYQIY